MNETLDIGAFDQPVLICGGAYGNLEALEALERWAQLHGFAHENIIHTGDAAAYCADPHLASSFIRKRGWPSIKGNVEEQLAVGADDCACGFEEGSVCNAMSAKWFAYADASISCEDRAWMAAVPSLRRFTLNGRRFLVVHGSVEKTNCFMFESLDEAVFAEQIALADCDAVIAGHTGIPFTRMIGGRVWHNSGALGMPANDATPRVWFSTLTPEGDAIRFAHHALVYDHQSAADKLRDADLPSGYADGLETGLWPSLDILPPAEKAMTGQPISRSDVLWQPALAQAI